jgi:hypothetical protein
LLHDVGTKFPLYIMLQKKFPLSLMMINLYLKIDKMDSPDQFFSNPYTPA